MRFVWPDAPRSSANVGSQILRGEAAGVDKIAAD
jgi:hypothetical protein